MNSGCGETLYIPDRGFNVTDCFVHNFTLAEIKTLRVRQRFDTTRDTQYDYQFGLSTLQEFLDLASNADRVVGVYPELKNPMFVNGLDIWNETNETGYEISIGQWNKVLQKIVDQIDHNEVKHSIQPEHIVGSKGWLRMRPFSPRFDFSHFHEILGKNFYQIIGWRKPLRKRKVGFCTPFIPERIQDFQEKRADHTYFLIFGKTYEINEHLFCSHY